MVVQRGRTSSSVRRSSNGSRNEASSPSSSPAPRRRASGSEPVRVPHSAATTLIVPVDGLASDDASWSSMRPIQPGQGGPAI